MQSRLASYLPILGWLRAYDLTTLTNDVLAAIIATIMLVPQSLAYAMLAGLPPQVGLYASLLPLIVYAVFGTSHTLAVGPVAIISLMTAAAVGQLALPGAAEYIAATLVLTLLSGLMLVLMGAFRLGFLANFLSHPMISGFITASAILIAASQFKHILGIDASGETLYDMLLSLSAGLHSTNPATLMVGASTLIFLLGVRKRLKRLLIDRGVKSRAADILAKLSPIIAVVVTTLAAAFLHLPELGVRIVGTIPQGLPPITIPSFHLDTWFQLSGAAR